MTRNTAAVSSAVSPSKTSKPSIPAGSPLAKAAKGSPFIESATKAAPETVAGMLARIAKGKTDAKNAETAAQPKIKVKVAELVALTIGAKAQTLTAGEAIDRIGELKAVMATIADHISGIQDGLLGAGLDVAEGDHFRGKRVTFDRIDLDSDLIKADLGKEWTSRDTIRAAFEAEGIWRDAYLKNVTVDYIKISARKGVAAK
jgi:hypothetical protein